MADEAELIARAKDGDDSARSELLAQHRQRLNRMIMLRLDRRLRKRVDASDVVQETLAEAALRLPQYLQAPPLPFYPWLRRMAWMRLIKLHQRHLAAKRSVTREQFWEDPSMEQLVEQLPAKVQTPSKQVVREETRERVRLALEQLSRADREVLVLRHVEQLSTREVAAVFEISESAAKLRHFRAIKRLRTLLKNDIDENLE